MPRKPRLQLSGFPLHVIQRGINHCTIFVDDADHRHYYQLLCETMGKHDIAVHAYVLMSNHVHLLMSSPEPDAMSRAMRSLDQCYAQAFNRRHRRCGTFWQGRYKSCLVNSDRHLIMVYRYIELNPVRAAMVEHPEQHPWSSVHANLGLLEDALVSPHPFFLRLGPDPLSRAETYRAWLREGSSQDDLDRIRSHLQQERALGDTTFQTMVENALGRPAQARPRGRPRRSFNGLDGDRE